MCVNESVQSTLYIYQNPIGRTKLTFIFVLSSHMIHVLSGKEVRWCAFLKSLPPPHHAQLTLTVLQGQGPRPAGMWFLHWWDQQMHQRHRASLPCSCQSEPGHQGWHLSWGMGDSTGTEEVMLSSLAYPAAFCAVWRSGAEHLAVYCEWKEKYFYWNVSRQNHVLDKVYQFWEDTRVSR